MEGMISVDTHVFNGRQKIAKQTYRYKHCCSVIFEIFISFYTNLELKSIHCLTSFCRKKNSQFDRKKGT